MESKMVEIKKSYSFSLINTTSIHKKWSLFGFTKYAVQAFYGCEPGVEINTIIPEKTLYLTVLNSTCENEISVGKISFKSDNYENYKNKISIVQQMIGKNTTNEIDLESYQRIYQLKRHDPIDIIKQIIINKGTYLTGKLLPNSKMEIDFFTTHNQKQL